MASPRAGWLLSLALLGGIWHASRYVGPFEDAFITYRYAENLATGRGLAFNVGERVEGYTSFLWTVVLAGFARIGAPLPFTSQALSLVAGITLLGLTAALARALRREVTGSEAPGEDALAACVVAASGTWAYYAPTGMETALFACLVAGAMILAIERRSAVGAGALLVLAALTRPEGTLYAAACVVALAARKEGRRDATVVLATFLAAYVPYFCIRYAYFGYPFPNTYYAKADPSATLLHAGLVYTEGFLLAHGFVVCAAAAGWLGVRHFSSRGPRLVLAIVLTATANAILVGGDTFAFFRVFLPAIVPGAAAFVLVCGVWLGARSPRLVPVVVAVLALVTFGAGRVQIRTFLFHRPFSEDERVLGVRPLNDGYFMVGRALRDGVPPDSVVALNAIGIIPHESRLTTIDMLGLTDVHIAHRRMALGRGFIGHEKHDAAYVLSRKPDIVILGFPTVVPRGPTPPGRVAAQLTALVRFLPGDAEMVAEPDFLSWYDPTWHDTGNGTMTVWFTRRATPRPPGERPPWAP